MKVGLWLSADAVYDRTVDLIVDGRFDEARRLLRRSLRRFPREPRLRLRYGLTLIDFDDHAARRELKRAAELGDVSIVLEAAMVVKELDPELGREFAIKAVDLEPSTDDDLACLAYLRGLYSEVDGYDQSALNYYRQAVEGDSRDPIYAEALIDLLVRLDRPDEARLESARALHLVFKTDRIDAVRTRHGLE